jgi:hypothetical protein
MLERARIAYAEHEDLKTTELGNFEPTIRTNMGGSRG